MKERLKQLRANLRLSQFKFAQEIQKSPGYIANFETGRGNLSVDIIDLICEKFSVNKEWLVSGKGEMFIIDELNSPDKNNIGDRVRFLQKSLKMTQQEFGDFVGYSGIQIQSVERKILIPSHEFLHKVAEKCNISEKWLSDGLGDMNDHTYTVDERLIRFLEANPDIAEKLMEKYGLLH